MREDFNSIISFKYIALDALAALWIECKTKGSVCPSMRRNMPYSHSNGCECLPKSMGNHFNARRPSFLLLAWLQMTHILVYAHLLSLQSHGQLETSSAFVWDSGMDKVEIRPGSIPFLTAFREWRWLSERGKIFEGPSFGEFDYIPITHWWDYSTAN